MRPLQFGNSGWRFFRCNKCGYWTSRTAQGSFPHAEYNDTPTFDYNPGLDWRETVQQATTIMAKKFRLAGKIGGRFLDVGCSEGVYVAAAAELGWTAVGSDIDPAKVGRAEARGLDVRHMDFSDCHFRQGFDFVLLRHVIEHIAEFVEFVRSVSCLLRPGGVLCVECPNQAGIDARLHRRTLKEGRFLGNLYPPSHIHAFEPRTLDKLGGKLGLRCQLLMTYSRSDRGWFLPAYYEGGGVKALAQMLAASWRMGGNLAAFYAA
ncbi:MAG TPA: class I SAM-dependent methyltransferase [Terriglobales bacterium]|nr:class I SAM-dependent methyltransferase [Terriglobales bacterium]